MTHSFKSTFLFICFGVIALFLWCGLTKDHHWGGDFAAFIMQAQAVVDGTKRELVETNRIALEKSSHLVGPVTYPWGVPVLLAPFYAYFGMNILALKAVNVICFLLFLLTIWFGFQRYHTGLWRVLYIFLFAINPFFIPFINQVTSDVPFLFFSTLAVILIGRVVIEKRWIFSEVSDHLLLGFILSLAFFVRTNGILLLLALPISQLIRMVQEVLPAKKINGNIMVILSEGLSQIRRKSLREFCVFVLPYASFVVTVSIWNNVFDVSEGNLINDQFIHDKSPSPFRILNHISLGTIKNTLYAYIELTAKFFSAVPHSSIVFGASIPFAIGGMLKRSRSDYHMLVFGGMTVLLLIILPIGAHLRYTFPLFPIYISFVLTGLETTLVINQGKWRGPNSVLLIGPLMAITLFFATQMAKDIYTNLTQDRIRVDILGPYRQTSQDIFSFISTNTDPSSVILFYKPRVMRLFSHRQSISVVANRLQDGDYLCSYIHDYRPMGQNDIEKFIKDGILDLVYKNTDFKLYRIKKIQ